MADVTDSFTDTDGTQLPSHNSNWVASSTFSNTPDINNNVACPDSAGNDQIVYWNGNGFEDNQYSEIVRTQSHSDDIAIGPAIRVQADGDCYVFYILGTGSNTFLYLVDGGSFSQLDAGLAGTNATYRVTATGSSIVCTQNGSSTNMPSATNGTIGSGQAGLHAYDDSTTRNTADSWLAGPITSTDLSINVNDGATVADSPTITPLVLADVSVSDALTVADSPTVSRQEATTLAIDVNDGATVADSAAIDPLILADVTVSDALTVADTPTVQLGVVGAYAISVSDGVNVADSPAIDPLILADVSVSDALTIGESATPLLIEADLNADKGADDYANWVVGVRLYTP